MGCHVPGVFGVQIFDPAMRFSACAISGGIAVKFHFQWCVVGGHKSGLCIGKQFGFADSSAIYSFQEADPVPLTDNRVHITADAKDGI